MLLHSTAAARHPAPRPAALVRDTGSGGAYTGRNARTRSFRIVNPRVHPTPSAITVAGIRGNSLNSALICGSTASTAEPSTAIYNRQLQRVFYTSALISIQRSPASKSFYERKRAQGKRHGQAVLALARRRANVLWAMLRDDRPYEEGHR